MDTPETTTRTGDVLRTLFRRFVLGVFGCTVLAIAYFVVLAVLGATGLSFDPHGYGVIFGTVLAVMLTPFALLSWLVYRSLRRRGD